MTAQAAHNLPKLSDKRDRLGRFEPGSGGRPKGAVSRIGREFLAQVKALGPEAIVKLGEAVRNSDEWAIKFVLNKILPQGRAIELHDTTPDDISEALKNGDIGITEAAELSATIAKLKDMSDLDDYRSSLAQIEKLLQGR